MDWLFGKRKTPAEMLREHKRSIDRAIRELERERVGLQRQEQKIIVEIKKTAKKGEMDAVKVMARDLVRTRKHVQKFYKMKTQLQGVSLKITTLKSNAAMAQAMQGVTRTMRLMNSRLNAPAIQRILMDFERQSEVMDMKEEVMNDAIDDAMDDSMDEEEETEGIVQQVLDEIGIDLAGQMAAAPAAVATAEAPQRDRQAVAAEYGGSSSAPTAPPTAPAPQPSEAADDDLMARLDALKRP